MQYITPILIPIGKWLLPYFLKIADKYLPELLEDIINKIKNKRMDKKMSETTEALKDTVVAVVADEAVTTVQTEKEELIAKLTAEIATTTSRSVKFRNTLYISLLEDASDAIVELIIDKLAKL